MNAIALFGAFEDREVRWNGDLDKPEWIAQDVAAVLGIKWDAHNLDDYDEDEKGRVTIPTLGGEQELLTVTEPGLYRLVFKSRKSKAKQFRRWVFHEVLPQIRKTGSYSVQSMQSEIADLKAMMQALMEQKAIADSPKPLFSEAEIRRQNQRELYWSTIPGTASYENCKSVGRLQDYQPEERKPDSQGLTPLGEVLNICQSRPQQKIK